MQRYLCSWPFLCFLLLPCHFCKLPYFLLMYSSSAQVGQRPFLFIISNSHHLNGGSCVPATVVSTLHIFTHLIVRTMLWERYYYNPLFTYGENMIEWGFKRCSPNHKESNWPCQDAHPGRLALSPAFKLPVSLLTNVHVHDWDKDRSLNHCRAYNGGWCNMEPGPFLNSSSYRPFDTQTCALICI